MALDQEALKKELIEAFRLEGIPGDKQEELLAKIGEALLKRIFLETMEKMGEAGIAEYEALLEKNAKQEELEAFFETKIPGYNVFVRGIVTAFKEEMQNGLA
ncbi:MAG: hypothetical protein A3E38_00745 [Candidatus Moranbacteria bacterium RIFCSPHIGHO2_12_FULL_54_9]|nr:MAG: hypothetical protein A2878_03120 [Candidatus Moranbacteria bacterium RIFCSPHIGHO2_01_FULL_54_31]OGI24521.1 MAG: hypothetical protein A3E38_00745 [Candidatus Moranbacteria bacterium RIFCSPHIGHO2_12_FULL_54_9]